ncbi:hypothetical protein COA06_32265, partial [Bacillus thuringiensis]
TNISAINPKNLTDEEIKGIYKDFSESTDWLGSINHGSLEEVTFKNIKPLENYVKQYRVDIEDIYGTSSTVKDSYPVNEDGSVTVRMMDYNPLWPIMCHSDYQLTILAITDDGREIPVYSFSYHRDVPINK